MNDGVAFVRQGGLWVQVSAGDVTPKTVNLKPVKLAAKGAFDS